VKQLLLLAGSILAALSLAETGARLWLPPPQRVTVRIAPDLDRRLQSENATPRRADYRGAVNALFVKTPTGRRLRANTEVTIEHHYLSQRTIVLRTNSLGFRGPEIGPREAGRMRALFLGDSITMAHYLPEEETFVHLVGALSEKTPHPIETVNAGVGGIGMETELAIFEETGWRADPDVVVLQFYLNDVQESPGVGIVRLPAALEWSRLAQYAAFALPRFAGRDDFQIGEPEMSRWLGEIRARAPQPPEFGALVQENYRDWGGAWSDGVWRRLDPVLAEFQRRTARRGTALRIVAFPSEPQVSIAGASDWPQRRLRETADRIGVPVLDLLPALRAARGASIEPLFYDVCHHTPAGSRVVAAAILDFLQARPAPRRPGARPVPAPARAGETANPSAG
jgi:hypothetical protein